MVDSSITKAKIPIEESSKGEAAKNNTTSSKLCDVISNDEYSPLLNNQTSSQRIRFITEPVRTSSANIHSDTETTAALQRGRLLSHGLATVHPVTGDDIITSKKLANPAKKNPIPNFLTSPFYSSLTLTTTALTNAAIKANLCRKPRPQIRNRLVQKNGEYNIRLANVIDQRSRYASDLWTTFIEVKWRWSLLACALSFLMSWFFFAVIYYCIIYAHGDLYEASRHQAGHHINNEWKPCLVEANSFMAVFMFSLETQHTIGYGSRHPSDLCPQMVFTVALQSIYGVVIQTLLVGIVFAKLTRPKNRAQTLIFSNQAVVALRDTKLCFMFRVGDMRKSHLAGGTLKVMMIRKHTTKEGEILPYYLHEMPVNVSGVDFCPPFSWPPIVVHTIDSKSPLYEYDATQLQTAKFEIMVILEGVNSSTGQNCQARTSYVPSEVLWGHRFDRLVTYQRENGEYRIDYNKFHSTFPISTPILSAKNLDALRIVNPQIDLCLSTDTKRSSVDHNRHDCNMWETPYSTIHREEDAETVEQNRFSIMKLKNLFDKQDN
uniref:Uncharacterized protein n=1 Tax=Romanomermis culicivorax TaxID=13658 RepID=A0A915JU76_ROMCU